MELKEDDEKVLLPHHVQQELCSTRLPYRQGRKLTAVKVYTINDESRHLLIFGVPSLNLRQETKAHFMRFGKLLLFTISKNHQSEQFTETYHAVYERIQSARCAKRIMDTKNYYGGFLHVTYAPELETVAETRQKLLQRRKDVSYRLYKLNKEETELKINANVNTELVAKESNSEIDKTVLYMGDINEIAIGKQPREVVKNLKRKKELNVIEKQFEPCFVPNEKRLCDKTGNINNFNIGPQVTRNTSDKNVTKQGETEIVDCSQTDNDVVTNIYESLNYNRFGGEIVKKIPQKSLNVIKFKNKS